MCWWCCEATVPEAREPLLTSSMRAGSITRAGAQPSLQALPPDVLRQVLAFLPFRDVVSASATCRALRRSGTEPRLWRYLLERDFHLSPSRTLCRSGSVPRAHVGAAGAPWRPRAPTAGRTLQALVRNPFTAIHMATTPDGIGGGALDGGSCVNPLDELVAPRAGTRMTRPLVAAHSRRPLAGSTDPRCLYWRISQIKTGAVKFTTTVRTEVMDAARVVHKYQCYRRWVWACCSGIPLCLVLPLCLIASVVLAALCWDGKVAVAVAFLPMFGVAAWLLLSFATDAMAHCCASRAGCVPLATAPVRGSIVHVLRSHSRNQIHLPWVFPVAWVVLGALAVLLMGLRAFAWDPLPLADVAWAWMLVPAGLLVLSLVCCSCFGGRGRAAACVYLALVAPVATSALLLALGLGGQIHINPGYVALPLLVLNTAVVIVAAVALYREHGGRFERCAMWTAVVVFFVGPATATEVLLVLKAQGRVDVTAVQACGPLIGLLCMFALAGIGAGFAGFADRSDEENVTVQHLVKARGKSLDPDACCKPLPRSVIPWNSDARPPRVNCGAFTVDSYSAVVTERRARATASQWIRRALASVLQGEAQAAAPAGRSGCV